MPLGMAGGIIAGMMFMLVITISYCIRLAFCEYTNRNESLRWLFGLIAIEVFLILVSMTNYIAHGTDT